MPLEQVKTLDVDKRSSIVGIARRLEYPYDSEPLAVGLATLGTMRCKNLIPKTQTHRRCDL